MPRPKGKTNAEYKAERAVRAAQAAAEQRKLSAETGSLDEATDRQRSQERVVKRQRADLVKLQASIRESLAIVRRLHNQDATDAQAIGNLTRSMEKLHEMEREAHGFNRKASQANAIIVLPVRADDIDAWADVAARVIGRDRLPAEEPSRLVESPRSAALNQEDGGED